MEKVFRIYNLGPEKQYIQAVGMGLILFREEIDELAAGFGSRIGRIPGDTTVDVIPPIAREKLPEVGGALIKLAQDLDPTPPTPTYEID